MNKFSSIEKMALVIFILSMCFQDVFAKEVKSVASIVRSTGQSIIRSPSGEERKAEVRDPLYAQDTLQTGEQAWLTVNFFDLTRIVLRPSTQLIIRKFPETMVSGDIEFEILSGGARVTTGTVAAQNPERFKVITPKGELTGGRSEWVIRICPEDDCELLEQSFSRCGGYQTVDKRNRQFVAVYKGVIDLEYCAIVQSVNAGQTASIDYATKGCEVVPEIPCFILSDDKLGRDKLRTFLPNLRLIPSDDSSINVRPTTRPNSRSIQPRPRVDRPRRTRRGQ